MKELKKFVLKELRNAEHNISREPEYKAAKKPEQEYWKNKGKSEELVKILEKINSNVL